MVSYCGNQIIIGFIISRHVRFNEKITTGDTKENKSIREQNETEVESNEIEEKENNRENNDQNCTSNETNGLGRSVPAMIRSPYQCEPYVRVWKRAAVDEATARSNSHDSLSPFHAKPSSAPFGRVSGHITRMENSLRSSNHHCIVKIKGSTWTVEHGTRHMRLELCLTEHSQMYAGRLDVRPISPRPEDQHGKPDSHSREGLAV
ncbi:unnamed protein product [Trichogramma brassicae]|uniref:Uncharacterized protein n=1 Tax=Trichogramma brassicae TaxID=86971 RepID=A0A6H5HUV6_9HYME|nr:unnamed protein product [Trichogramma brassicae]